MLVRNVKFTGRNRLQNICVTEGEEEIAPLGKKFRSGNKVKNNNNNKQKT